MKMPHKAKVPGATAGWHNQQIGGRGRDGPYGPPPAQIRTGGITAYGSYVGYFA